MSAHDHGSHDLGTHDHETTVRRSRSVGRSTFTVGQATAAIVGLVLLVLGGVVMARVGFDSLTDETTELLGIGHTLAAGIIHLILGLVFLSAATTAPGVRSTLIGLGTLAVAFGAVVMIEPDPFVGLFGDGRPVGVMYLVIGLIALIAGVASPTFVTQETAYRDDHVDESRIVE